jgi:hypothetical protein
MGGGPSATPSCVSIAVARALDASTAFAIPKSVTTAVPPREQDVLRLDVAMYHAFCVSERERARHVASSSRARREAPFGPRAR